MRPVVPSEPRPYLNGVYPHESFRKSHRVQAMDVGGLFVVGVLSLIGVGLLLVVLFGVIWVAVWMGEAVLRWFR